MIDSTMALLRKVSMMVELAGHSGSPVMSIPLTVVQVRDELTRRIHRRDAGYRPGDRLPTHEQLAAELPSSRASVARAIALLRAEGILVGVRGSGVYVAEGPQ